MDTHSGVDLSLHNLRSQADLKSTEIIVSGFIVGPVSRVDGSRVVEGSVQS